MRDHPGWRDFLTGKDFMNGYVEFQTPDGEPVVVNADRVNFVRRYRGESDTSAVNFEKGNYVVVRGSFQEVTRALADA